MHKQQVVKNFKGHLLIGLIITVYFTINWSVPWYKFGDVLGPINLYLFDFTVVLVLSWLCGSYPSFSKLKNINIFIVFVIITSLLLAASLYYTEQNNLQHPFRLLASLFLKLVFVAPIIEELIFRHAFWVLLRKKYSQGMTLIFTSILFSLSHGIGFLVLPDAFHEFIKLQLGYTFFLGLFAGLGKLWNQSLLSPIILHGIFNLGFYLALNMRWI